VRTFLSVVTLASLTIVLGCGGSSSSGSSSSGSNSSSNPASGANVQPIVVNSGPLGHYANGVFTSVTVCAPGTSTCQTISGVLVDTGSYGLRVLSSALNGLALAQQNDASGSPIVECAQFADGITWGPIETAVVKMAGEQSSRIPIQVIGDPKFPDSTIPPACANQPGGPQDTQQALMTNGILGVGPFRQDCGGACAPFTSNNPGFYYACPTASTCVVTTENISQQVQNPVWMFATDNNGVIVELPAVPATGALSVNGSLIFGIGTQSNNGLGSAKVFTPDPMTGNFTTQYQGTSYTKSFIDSGSNGLFFGQPTTVLKACTDTSGKPTGFYCPDAPQNLSAMQQGANGTSAAVNFTVGNANTLFSANNFAFNDLAGSNTANIFDWGLSFFFGRNVYTAIEGQSVPSTTLTGPFWAY
jgi:Protein of unknown function (DUF3443)